MSTDPDLLDQVEAALRQADGPITSGDLAERLNIDDAEANPKTREAIRNLVEDGRPIVGFSNGYRFIEDEDDLAWALDNLDSRIAGIEQRKQWLLQAYDEGRQKQLAGGVQ